MDYEHPMFTPDSVATRPELPKLNDGVVAFAGAYHGWGFHEDGCRSGVAAAASLGADW
jgi:predicted NAD/FAD-binding protein